MYHFFRPTGAATAGDETELVDAGCIAEDEGGGVATATGPEGVEPGGVGTLGVDRLKDELLPESISRFSRFRSPRISDATW